MTNPPPIRVRPACARDAAAIAGFNRAMARETERRDLVPHIVAAGVAALIADPTRGFYLLAEVDARPVGAVMVTYDWSDWSNALVWWLQSVYVTPEYRRRGIYRALHARVLELARQRSDVHALRLCVDKGNRRAHTVYRALGMKASHYRLFEQDL